MSKYVKECMRDEPIIDPKSEERIQTIRAYSENPANWLIPPEARSLDGLYRSTALPSNCRIQYDIVWFNDEVLKIVAIQQVVQGNKLKTPEAHVIMQIAEQFGFQDGADIGYIEGFAPGTVCIRETSMFNRLIAYA